MKLAFAGFRHGHIFSLYKLASERSGLSIVAAAEDDGATREALKAKGGVAITHDSIDAMLAEAECDIVAVGDYYGARGTVVRKALEAGRHVIVDKPVCALLEELDAIEALTRSTGLRLGCMFDLRDRPAALATRRVLRDGTIGEVQAIQFGGQHPLNRASRPGWYFEPGKHGGTLNDIAIHAFDLIPWATGRPFKRVVAARVWGTLADAPHFQNGAQVMLELDGGAGVLGDVSYHMPDALGYTAPQYWRMTLFGTRGVLEASLVSGPVTLLLPGSGGPKVVELPEAASGQYLQSFLDDIAGRPAEDGALTTQSVLRAARNALTAQRAADESLRDVPLA